MRAGPPNSVLAGWVEYECKVQSWLGASLLAADVPVSDGGLVGSVRMPTLYRITVDVPRFGETGFDWRPASDEMHPLSRHGQELNVTILVTSPVSGLVWKTQLGRFLITDWEDGDDGIIRVIAEGRLRRVSEAKITLPLQPAAGGTLASEARRLAPGGLGVAFDSALVDRPCPSGMVWSSDRLDAMLEIARAWPAQLRTDEWGQFVYKAPLPEVPVPLFTLQNGDGGTVSSMPSTDTRDEAYNQIVVRSSKPGAEDIQAVAEVLEGPMSISNYGAVTREFATPLVENYSQAQLAANTMLQNSQRPAKVRRIIAASDPRVDLDDPLQLLDRTGSQLERTWGYVTGFELPLVGTNPLMTVDLGVSS